MLCASLHLSHRFYIRFSFTRFCFLPVHHVAYLRFHHHHLRSETGFTFCPSITITYFRFHRHRLHSEAGSFTRGACISRFFRFSYQWLATVQGLRRSSSVRCIILIEVPPCKTCVSCYHAQEKGTVISLLPHLLMLQETVQTAVDALTPSYPIS